MTRKLFFIIFATVLFALNAISSSAQITVGISSFTTPFNSIGWDALNNRTARIPVSWTTQNRLLTSNLVFEQILHDGSRLNVELPRLIPYVASNGDGVVAPILPDGANQITIRVSLINLLTGSAYDVEYIHLPIVSGDSGSDDRGFSTGIVNFEADDSAPISRTQLSNGTARVRVSWETINRPITANLYFYQVMPNGSHIDIELPRDFAWVNSSDSGVVAPILPEGDVDHIQLRVSLINIGPRGLIDQRTITIPIQTEANSPSITSFSTTTSEILDEAVNDSLIDVSWVVNNRPSNTNLVFEQVLPNGTTRNAELPRNFVIVPSSGNGIVDPILPQADTDVLVFRLRLVDLSNNATLTSADITVNLVSVDIRDRVVVTGNACYTGSFAPSQDLNIGSEGRIQLRDNGVVGVSVFEAPNNNDVLNTALGIGDTFTIEDAPYCTYSLANGSNTSRRWRINANGQRGWIEEYHVSDTGYVYNFVRADREDLGRVSIDNFTVSPTTVAAGELDSTIFTITWATSNATQLYISYVDDIPNYNSGSVTVNGADINSTNANILFHIDALDSQNNSQNIEVIVPVATTTQINNFSLTPDTARGNEEVTFTWDFVGDFESASIWTSAPYSGQLDVIHSITSQTGTFSYTLPDNYATRDLTFTLDITDNDGVGLTESAILHYACAYQWGLNISNSDCPSSALITRVGAYQTFERGFMVWLPSEAESMWIFYNDGRVERYPDYWDGTDFTVDGTPPEGTFAPERGFGYLWQTTPAVRNGLGWATGSELSYTSSNQSSLSADRYSLVSHYIQLPDGTVIHASRSELGAPLMWVAQ